MKKIYLISSAAFFILGVVSVFTGNDTTTGFCFVLNALYTILAKLEEK